MRRRPKGALQRPASPHRISPRPHGVALHRRILTLITISVHAAIALAVLCVPISAIVRSFGETPLTSDGVQAIGLARWPLLLLNTLIVTGTATAIAVGIGLPVGVLVGRSDLPGRQVVR